VRTRSPTLFFTLTPVILHAELYPPEFGIRTQDDPELYQAEDPVKETIPVGAAATVEETVTVQTVEDSC